MPETLGRHAARHARPQDEPLGLLARLRAILPGLERAAEDPAAVDEAARLHLARTAAELRDALAKATAASVAEGVPLEESPAVAAARQYAPSRRRPNHLREVRGFAPVAALGALLGRHAFLAAAASVSTAAVVTGVAVGVTAAHHPGTSAHPPSGPNPAAIIQAASRIPPAAYLSVRAPGHKGVTMAKGQGRQIAAAPPDLLPVPAGQYQPPPPLSYPPPPGVTAPSPQAAGELVVPAGSSGVDLGTTQAGSVRIEVWGGPVSWTAASSLPGLTLDGNGSESGTQSTVIGLTLDPADAAAAGSATVTVTWGGQQTVVPVTWEAPPPSASPSPADTSPADAPAPSPSPS